MPVPSIDLSPGPRRNTLIWGAVTVAGCGDISLHYLGNTELSSCNISWEYFGTYLGTYLSRCPEFSRTEIGCSHGLNFGVVGTPTSDLQSKCTEFWHIPQATPIWTGNVEFPFDRGTTHPLTLANMRNCYQITWLWTQLQMDFRKLSVSPILSGNLFIVSEKSILTWVNVWVYVTFHIYTCTSMWMCM